MTAPKEKLINLDIKRDGPVLGSQLESILNQAFETVLEALENAASRIEEQDREITRLRHAIETERRLRLGMGARR